MKYIVTLNGKNYEVDVTKTDAVITSVSPVASAAPVAPAAPAAPAAPVAPAAPAAPTADGTKVTSPMPGNILAVNVSAGQAVKEGDVMFILEAMKMENEIVAPASGTVKQVLVSKGAVVETDAVLAVL
ncbi:MAG: biotin/lipoyl-binding protein [Ruminococcaceae bacterium]|nr:biotin/lipoyl-binding protein [Oscillospiraceae bacterium]MBR3596732.1 biotin/lipoyl-binding protein [Clostridia bacterium]